MKVISVNVGLPQEVQWQGKLVTTGIFKQPVTGRVMLHALNLNGDGQADLSMGVQTKQCMLIQLSITTIGSTNYPIQNW